VPPAAVQPLAAAVQKIVEQPAAAQPHVEIMVTRTRGALSALAPEFVPADNGWRRLNPHVQTIPVTQGYWVWGKRVVRGNNITRPVDAYRTGHKVITRRPAAHTLHGSATAPGHPVAPPTYSLLIGLPIEGPRASECNIKFSKTARRGCRTAAARGPHSAPCKRAA
jgi:hypothetical protein